ncbi:3-dehydroquinate synthase, partial [Alphaproteobacteria bacterium]|nr:3-dehydroquinate synthase [Alphaproteobacteria bacterium]
YYLSSLNNSLMKSQINFSNIILPSGEKVKSFYFLENLCSQVLEKKIERKDIIIALGGGVIGDLTGFAAGIIRRGIRYIQIPTTLLSQVDSSVGGKTAIDTKHGKNLIGLFNQPSLVICDIKTLNSLDEREIISGYAEIVKYALIRDKKFFKWLLSNGQKVIEKDKDALEYAIVKSCKHKAQIVSSDEFETNNFRALLNFGHTFAHAIENSLNYKDSLKHGEAVAIGIIMAFELSIHLNLCKKEDLILVKKHFTSLGLPTSVNFLKSEIDVNMILKPMLQDKKNINGKIIFILAKGIGSTFLADFVSIEDAKKIISNHLK